LILDSFISAASSRFEKQMETLHNSRTSGFLDTACIPFLWSSFQGDSHFRDDIIQSMTQPPICNYEGSAYQTVFWDQADRRYEDLSEEFALRALLPRQGKTLLELGAGAGRNTPRYTGFQHIVLVDYSFSQLEQARERLGHSSRFIFVAANIYSLPFSTGFFDAATLIRTLHHLSDPLTALRETRRTLSPGAFFLLEYANKQNIKSIIRYFLKRQNWNPFSEDAVEFVHLNYDFHPRAIRRWLTDAGFRVRRQKTVSHFRSAWLKKIFPAAWLAGIDSVVGSTGNFFQLSPSVFVSCVASPGQINPAEGMFQCPVCQTQIHHLPSTAENGSMLCSGCERTWEIRNGIYDFRESVSG
jgi:ubiquinone/menaquinone biosynthesis C-methylase UbiE